MLKDTWKDPVWSKVIAAGVLWVVALGYAYIKSVAESITFQQAATKLIEPRISIFNLLISATFILIIYFILNRLKKTEKPKKQESIYSEKQKLLRTLNKVEYSGDGVLFRWEVFFDFSGNPFISELNAFCTKHDGAPLRFIGTSCPVRNCPNSTRQVDFNATQNQIESDLIDKWEKLKATT